MLVGLVAIYLLVTVLILHRLLIFRFSCCRYFHTQKMKFSIKDFFSKCDRIRRKLRIWSHLLKKSLMENLVFCVVIRLNATIKLKHYIPRNRQEFFAYDCKISNTANNFTNIKKKSIKILVTPIVKMCVHFFNWRN